jgi:hypothetical protein
MMVKRLALVAAVLLLVGCGKTTPSIDTDSIRAAVSQVRDKTVKICSFLPTTGTVTEILASAVPALDVAQKIAEKICAAVTGQPVGQSLYGAQPQCPMVNGVCVEGKFVDPNKPIEEQE